MPTAPANEQFLHDYYDRFQQSDFPDLDYDQFSQRVEQASQKDPSFVGRMSKELQTQEHTMPEAAAPSERFMKGYYDAYQGDFAHLTYDQFKSNVSDQAAGDNTFLRRMSNELFVFYKHKLDRETYELQYGLRSKDEESGHSSKRPSWRRGTPSSTA